MTATTTSKKFQDLTGTSMGRCTGLVLAMALLLGASSVQAATIYADGENINLATGRSNTFSTGGPSNNQFTGPLHLAYPDLRFDAYPSANGAYWQVNFPTAYQVSSIFVETHPAPYRTTSLNVQTTVDGMNWVTQATPTVVSDVAGDRLTANFTPVSGVVGVRLLSASSENAGYPAIYRQIRITGPNENLPMYLNDQTEFSITQAIWNGGVVQSAPGWGSYSGGTSTILPIDDATTDPFYYNKTIYNTTAPDPAPIDILLNDNYVIDTVGITTGGEVTGRTATHVDISYSSDVSGAFTPILTNVPLLGSSDNHYLISLGGMFDARRIRYDFSHPGSASADTFIAELEAFAVQLPPPAPEPTSIMLLGAGLGLLAIERRRQGKAARAAKA
jgi:hypothetical protein